MYGPTARLLIESMRKRPEEITGESCGWVNYTLAQLLIESRMKTTKLRSSITDLGLSIVRLFLNFARILVAGSMPPVPFRNVRWMEHQKGMNMHFSKGIVFKCWIARSKSHRGQHSDLGGCRPTDPPRCGGYAPTPP